MIHDAGPGYGGAEILAVEIVRRLDPARFAPYLCVTKAPPGDRREQLAQTTHALQADGIPVLALDRGSSLDLLPWRSLYRLLRRESIDVVHSHMLRANIPGTVLGRLARVPVIVTHEHIWSFDGRPLRRLLDREVVARLSDLSLAVSEDNRRRMVEREGIAPDRVRVLRNGLPERPGPTSRDVRAELGIGHDVPLIGAIGRLTPEKAFEILVEAMEELKADVPGVRAVIVGDGPERDRLRGLIDERGLGREVLLAGRRSDVSDVLAALDVAVLSSKIEGSPVALLEYMAAAKPIVATRVGGVPELVHDGVHALLVDPGSPAAVAGGIRRLLGDRRRGATMGEAARRRQREQFGMKAMVDRLQDIYLELYARQRSAR